MFHRRYLKKLSSLDVDLRMILPPVSTSVYSFGLNQLSDSTSFILLLSGNFAGDFSVSTAALFHVWVKEHNRIATELKVINPHWGDEKTFEESRRIVGAEIQHITYGEFLPIILGSQTVMERNLSLQNFGYYNGYNISADVEINNAYAMAIGLFFHTMWLDSVDDAVLGSAVELSELILNPQWLYFQDYLKSNIISSLKVSS